MSVPLAEPRIRRILMALDATDRCLAALEETAMLAARLDAELLGLFVEDLNLVRLASLPFARETGTASAITRQIEDAGMARALRAQAQRASAALASVAARRRVQARFRVTRGQVAAVVLEAAREADLLILALARGELVGARIRAVLSGAPRRLLLLREGVGISAPVTVVTDCTTGEGPVLDVACDLARTIGEQTLTVVIPTGEPGSVRMAPQDLAARAQRAGLVLRMQEIARGSDRLLQAIAAQGRGTLVVGARFERLVPQLLACMECTILVAR